MLRWNIKCEVCGKTFEVTKFWRNIKKYCSPECQYLSFLDDVDIRKIQIKNEKEKKDKAI